MEENNEEFLNPDEGPRVDIGYVTIILAQVAIGELDINTAKLRLDRFYGWLDGQNDPDFGGD